MVEGECFHFIRFFTFIPVPFSPLSLSFISSTISSVFFLPFSGRWHKMTHKGWRVVKSQHNQSVRTLRSTKLIQLMILGWPLTFLWQGQICIPIPWYGENEKSFSENVLKTTGWNLQCMIKVSNSFSYNENFAFQGYLLLSSMKQLHRFSPDYTLGLLLEAFYQFIQMVLHHETRWPTCHFMVNNT